MKWSHRWDVYLKGNPDDEIHYFSIVNSLMIVLFLTGVVAMIMLRVLNKDISSYNEMQTLEEAQEESGWKLVHGDVFRPPSSFPMLLAVLAGLIPHNNNNYIIRIWSSNLSHDYLHDDLRFIRLNFPIQQRRIAHHSPHAFRLHGFFRRLLLRENLQVIQRKIMEAKHCIDRYSLSWSYGNHLLSN